MTDDTDELLEPYAYDQPEYAGAFETFLTHTDQKIKAIGWLTDFVVDSDRAAFSSTQGPGKVPRLPH